MRHCLTVSLYGSVCLTYPFRKMFSFISMRECFMFMAKYVIWWMMIYKKKKTVIVCTIHTKRLMRWWWWWWWIDWQRTEYFTNWKERKNATNTFFYHSIFIESMVAWPDGLTWLWFYACLFPSCTHILIDIYQFFHEHNTAKPLLLF